LVLRQPIFSDLPDEAGSVKDFLVFEVNVPDTVSKIEI
jgi:hypothetical protein